MNLFKGKIFNYMIRVNLINKDKMKDFYGQLGTKLRQTY